MYAWLNAQIGTDAASIVSFVILGIILLIALWLYLIFLRRLNNRTSYKKNKSQQTRLSVSDSIFLDRERRLVLIRRDSVEYLLLVGGVKDCMLIEQHVDIFEKKNKCKKEQGLQDPKQFSPFEENIGDENSSFIVPSLTKEKESVSEKTKYWPTYSQSINIAANKSSQTTNTKSTTHNLSLSLTTLQSQSILSGLQSAAASPIFQTGYTLQPIISEQIKVAHVSMRTKNSEKEKQNSLYNLIPSKTEE